MPKPEASESKATYIGRCVKEVMGEGKSQKEALGRCYGMWNTYKKSLISKIFIDIKKQLSLLVKKAELLEKYESEIDGLMKARTVDGYESPEPGDISEKGKQLLARIYANCRKDGGDKEKCARIAWSAVERAGYKSINKVKILKEIHSKISNIVNIFKALPVGTKREWKEGIFEKQPDGSWKKITEPKEKPKDAKEVEKPKEKEIPKAITDFEDKIRLNTIESAKGIDKKGKLILQKEGNENSVTFTPEDMKRLKNAAYFSHNHPTGHSFSSEDIYMAMYYNMGQMRATGKLKKTEEEYTYIFSKKKDGIKFNKDNGIKVFNWAQHENITKREELTPLVTSRKISEGEAEKRHWHEIWEKASQKFKFNYKRIAHGRKK